MIYHIMLVSVMWHLPTLWNDYKSSNHLCPVFLKSSTIHKLWKDYFMYERWLSQKCYVTTGFPGMSVARLLGTWQQSKVPCDSGQRYYSTLVTGSCWEGPSWGHLESWCLSCPGNSEWGWPPMTGSRVSSCQNTSPPTIAGLTFISRDVLSVDPQLLQIVLDSPAKRDTVGSVLWEVHVVLHYDVGHLPFRPAIGQTRTKNVVSETPLKTQDEIHSWCQFLSILKNWEA